MSIDDESKSRILQNTTHLPFSSIEALSQKDVKSGRIQLRVIGVIVHGYGRFFYVIDQGKVQKGANQGMYMVFEFIHVGPHPIVHCQ